LNRCCLVQGTSTAVGGLDTSGREQSSQQFVALVLCALATIYWTSLATGQAPPACDHTYTHPIEEARTDMTNAISFFQKESPLTKDGIRYQRKVLTVSCFTRDVTSSQECMKPAADMWNAVEKNPFQRAPRIYRVNILILSQWMLNVAIKRDARGGG